eukprot:CAMPEP_0113560204 /NCGR_PEP_ID=MMETSP0015_2-20120614/19304_1 /TAXON_ID=2838 /ORGANISM="Odontella" /LENGTH=302 /DNA_ID=CAMNT_0000461889 /DNA_START=47 /DNA_END=955 /DNA_ORIENTATION=+ /assembly_acc=CAM_ASM_000160
MTSPRRLLGSPLLLFLCRWAALSSAQSTPAAFVLGPSSSFVGTTATSDGVYFAPRRRAVIAGPPPVRVGGVGVSAGVLLGASPSGGDGVESPSKEDGQAAAADAMAAQIGEMIEATFVNACLQLVAGYVDVLKLFVVAVKAGYENGIPIPELIREVEECPSNTAGRDLMAEERALRDAWINVVYLALGEDGHASEDGGVTGESVDPGAREKFGPAVADVVKARRSSPEGKAPTFEEVRDAHPELLEGKGAEATPLEVAVASQSLRVVNLTITVVDEEMECHDGGGAGPAPKPRPPIPGAFKD